MSNSNISPDVGSSEPLPTFESLQKAQKGPTLSHEAACLFWSLQDSLKTSIFVMRNKKSPDPPLEPYFRQTLDAANWHPLSQEPMTRPPVSSITVDVYELENWLDEWLEVHAECIDEGRILADAEEGQIKELEDEERELLRCCGTERPPNSEPIVVPASGKPYVTIHDYVTAVHPWLMNKRNDILWAMNVWDCAPLPAETKLMVNCNGPASLMIDKEETWIARTRRRTGVRTTNIPVSGSPYLEESSETTS
ncbi:hypothetical protein TARUN_6357 [Trichoderma arundinaceum]|uniref:Uncharacterized protein n=1 Tax=Trichoderma arundinaceum TaxID=490622 RepID=A0A395NII0_TRIAR|nr:hypothetical protein TARUN_6357 [Trichoderma arundinaceum]